jgi:hypothetical protein
MDHFQLFGNANCWSESTTSPPLAFIAAGSIQDANAAKRRGRNALALAVTPRHVRHTNPGVSR